MFLSAGKFQAINKAALLTLFQMKANQGILDMTQQTTFDTAKTAPLSSTQALYGSQSIQFAGNTTTELISSAGVGGQVGNSDFTMEAWIFPTASSGNHCIMSNQGVITGVNTFQFLQQGLKFSLSDTASRFTLNGSLTQNAWNHVAICKPGSAGATAASVYLNGVLDIVTTAWTSNYTAAGFSVGGRTDGANPFTGFIDSVRITRKIMYTSNFTPAEFPNNFI